MAEAKKLFIINLGSTSTKVAYYEDDKCILSENVKHDAAKIRELGSNENQYQYRYDTLIDFMEKHDIDPKKLDAFVARAGNTSQLPVGGIYDINDVMLEESKSKKYGHHIADIGLIIADSMRKTFGIRALTADPPVTCEFEPFAHYSGMPEIERIASFHVLNQRAVGKWYAKDRGKKYDEINLIGVHMGGGISVAVHKKGKFVDSNNALYGDGPFSTNRTGSLPVGALVDLCYSGKYTRDEVMKKINGDGGLMGYLGENDAKTIEDRALAGDEKCAEVLGAMCYQIAKEIGACSAVLCGDVEAIVMTGGMANSKFLTSSIAKYVSFIAPVVLYPGEFEMEALAGAAYAALIGEEPIKKMRGGGIVDV